MVMPGSVSFFESTIRHLGGLLSIYQLTGDILFLQKAEMVGQVLEYSYGTPEQRKDTHGLPYGELKLDQVNISHKNFH